ncbi:hypothetical protein DEO72_LG11g895 [Vigna unguiculata]|uniref:Transmembrane protein n=1 Tax=Vigna unguiculata TaxID=3917 RepID=A0A4D6NQ08_VIGUN|nr:hypothetical protein DEO72_LG11g895 [Vigna unguiculata]
MKNKAYTILMGLELTLIGIKYEGSNTNPFQHSTPILLLFLTATCSHLLASTAQTTCPTIFIFHVSGVVGCEALLWILISPEFIWWDQESTKDLFDLTPYLEISPPRNYDNFFSKKSTSSLDRLGRRSGYLSKRL